MNNKVNRKRLIGSSLTLVLALALALAIWSPVLSQSVEPTEGKTIMEAKMMACCQDMKAQKDKLWDDLKAQDFALSQQVVRMNGAMQDKKMGLMAAVVTRIVEQRTATNVRMEKMQNDMMEHLMQHMQMGVASRGPRPMMKGMKDTSQIPGEAQIE